MCRTCILLGDGCGGVGASRMWSLFHFLRLPAIFLFWSDLRTPYGFNQFFLSLMFTVLIRFFVTDVPSPKSVSAQKHTNIH